MNHVLPTLYNGIKYRSRTEARWAMYFDLLGHKFIYEPEGFDLGNGTWYLPDFYLPERGMFVEVKFQEFSEEEKEKCRRLCLITQKDVLMLDGPPDLKNYIFYTLCKTGAWVEDPDGDLPDFVHDGGFEVEESDLFFVSEGFKYYPFYWGTGHLGSECSVEIASDAAYYVDRGKVGAVRSARFDKHPAHLN